MTIYTDHERNVIREAEEIVERRMKGKGAGRKILMLALCMCYREIDELRDKLKKLDSQPFK